MKFCMRLFKDLPHLIKMSSAPVKKQTIKKVVTKKTAEAPKVEVAAPAPKIEVAAPKVEEPAPKAEKAKRVSKKVQKSEEVAKIKKNKSAYLFFCDEERVRIAEGAVKFAPQDVLKELGARWDLLKKNDALSLKRLNELAAKDKERYLSEKAAM